MPLVQLRRRRGHGPAGVWLLKSQSKQQITISLYLTNVRVSRVVHPMGISYGPCSIPGGRQA